MCPCEGVTAEIVIRTFQPALMSGGAQPSNPTGLSDSYFCHDRASLDFTNSGERFKERHNLEFTDRFVFVALFDHLGQ